MHSVVPAEQIRADRWARRTGRLFPKEPFLAPGTGPEADDSARDCSELAHPDSSAQLGAGSDPDVPAREDVHDTHR